MAKAKTSNRKEFKMTKQLCTLYDRMITFSEAKENIIKKTSFWGIDQELFRTAHECYSDAAGVFWRTAVSNFPLIKGKAATAAIEDGEYIIYYYE